MVEDSEHKTMEAVSEKHRGDNWGYSNVQGFSGYDPESIAHRS